MKSLLPKIASNLILVVIFAISALAQADVTSATVRGTITDQQGAAIPNASVMIKSTDQGTVRTAQSDENGEFVFLTLRPGPYELTVSATGFSRQLVKDLQLTIGQVIDLPLKLQIGGVAGEVTISTEAPFAGSSTPGS